MSSYKSLTSLKGSVMVECIEILKHSYHSSNFGQHGVTMLH